MQKLAMFLTVGFYVSSGTIVGQVAKHVDLYLDQTDSCNAEECCKKYANGSMVYFMNEGKMEQAFTVCYKLPERPARGN